MAEALFADWLKRNAVPGEWRVGSMGTWAVEGAPATEYARQVMAERGLDISRHRSRMVNENRMAHADLVLCLTRSHREALHAEFPQYASRVQLLSEMIGQTLDVEDPYGAGLAEYAETAKELANLLASGGQRIVELAGGGK